MTSMGNMKLPTSLEKAGAETASASVCGPEPRSVAHDNRREHEMTLAFVAKNHPKIIWWSLFWCMCAVGCEWAASIHSRKIRRADLTSTLRGL